MTPSRAAGDSYDVIHKLSDHIFVTKMDSKKRSRWLILLCTLSCLSMRVFSEQCRPRDCGCTSAVEGLVVDLTRLDDHLIEQQIPRP